METIYHHLSGEYSEVERLISRLEDHGCELIKTEAMVLAEVDHVLVSDFFSAEELGRLTDQSRDGFDYSVGFLTLADALHDLKPRRVNNLLL